MYKIRILEDGWKSGFGAFVGWNSSNLEISCVLPNCLFANGTKIIRRNQVQWLIRPMQEFSVNTNDEC